MFIQMTNIVVDFGPVRAVKDVSIDINPGEIIGLLGENGAGKSTLMNVLGGALQPTSGQIIIDDAPQVLATTKVAGSHGIRFIHQELNLCNDLRVYENMFLGEELRGPLGLLDSKTMVARARTALARVGVHVDPYALVGDLEAAEKQLVECAKALIFDARLIIMDEPSTALTAEETENLFTVMRGLKSEGVSFIYISHKMPELFAVCERYYVLRDGVRVADGLFAKTDEDAITALMIGRQLAAGAFKDRPSHAGEEVRLEARDLGGKLFADVSFELHRGEVLAVTGLQGSGRDELADVLFGVSPFTGSLSVHGKAIRSGANIRSFMKRGIAMVPRLRKERGIHNDLSILDNHNMAYINTVAGTPWVSKKAALTRYERQRRAMSIKANHPSDAITTLSGGNQQKVILGKWLEVGADIIILDNPTQGIDVGTKFEIYSLIHELARSGKSVLVFSGEALEIENVADRCIVMFKGHMNTTLTRTEISERELMYYSTGANLGAE